MTTPQNVPYVFQDVTDPIPLSRLDADLAYASGKLLSVCDAAFGAVGDDSTDDAPAINACIQSITQHTRGGFFVWFPPGKIFKIASPLVITNRWLTLLSTGGMLGPNGSQIHCTDPNIDMIDCTTGIIDSFSMMNLVVWGGGKGAGTGRGVAVGVSGDASRVCFSSQFANCWFTALPTIGIDLQNSSDVRISNGAVENCAKGININGSTYSGGLTGTKVTDVTIFGNTVGVFITNGAEDCAINGNTFWSCGTSPGGVPDSVSGGVVIDQTGTNAVRGIQIVGNKNIANVNDILLFGHNGSDGLNTGVNDILVASNSSDRPTARFILVDGANAVSIVGNKINAPNQNAGNAPGEYDCIEVIGTSDRVFIDGNEQTNNSASPAQPRYGLNVGASVTSLCIGVNHFDAKTASYNITTGATFLGGAVNSTWTPTLIGDSGAGTPTYVTRDGAWSRVGDHVFMSCDITISAFGGSPTGNVAISGVPFTCGKPINWTIGAIGSLTYPLTTKVITARVNTGDTKIYLIANDSAVASEAIDVSNVGAAFSINLSAAFRAA